MKMKEIQQVIFASLYNEFPSSEIGSGGFFWPLIEQIYKKLQKVLNFRA